MTNDIKFPLCKALLTGALMENSVPHRDVAETEAARILVGQTNESLVQDMTKTELDLQIMYDVRDDMLDMNVGQYAEAVGYDISCGDEDTDGFEPTHGHAKIPQSAINFIEDLLF
jgi:hypothetical protein